MASEREGVVAQATSNTASAAVLLRRVRETFAQAIQLLPTSPRQLIVLAHDLLMAALSYVLAYMLRYGTTDLGPERTEALIQGTILFTLIAFVVFLFLFDFYREVWRYTSLRSLVTIIKATSFAIAMFFMVSYLVDRGEHLPRSVPIIQWFILIVMLGGPRFFYRVNAHQQGRLRRRGSYAPVPVLLIGTDDLAALFLRALEHDAEPLYRVVGILDPQSGERGREIAGVPVLGGLSAIETAIAQLDKRGRRPQRLVVTRPMSSEVMRSLLELCERHRMTLGRLPSLTEFKRATDDGRVELRPIAIEELLGRAEANLDQASIAALLRGRRVLVTGAGGSIGAELVRQIARRKPAHLVLADHGEFNLYAIDHELESTFPDVSRRSVLVDVRDAQRVRRLFAEERPELVFHAAALKHVPLVEHNPSEGVLTNVVGTRNVADAACDAGVKAFVQVSTDKAVNPTNVMGMTKRLAEFYIQALDLAGARDGDKAPGPRFMTVRFGNVLGSSGSVVPLFQRQLESGGPLTVTHAEVQRYFMTIREAVELVLQASAHGCQHEDQRGQIFVLDMGRPLRIIDVARQMIRLAGLEPERDVAIKIVGLRPGEKLFEELFDEAEQRLPASVSGVLAAVSQPIELSRLHEILDSLERAARSDDVEQVHKLMRQIVPLAPPRKAARSALQGEAVASLL
jgi:O-antigen biosynthesis protein WbqV